MLSNYPKIKNLLLLVVYFSVEVVAVILIYYFDYHNYSYPSTERCLFWALIGLIIHMFFIYIFYKMKAIASSVTLCFLYGISPFTFAIITPWCFYLWSFLFDLPMIHSIESAGSLSSTPYLAISLVGLIIMKISKKRKTGPWKEIDETEPSESAEEEINSANFDGLMKEDGDK